MIIEPIKENIVLRGTPDAEVGKPALIACDSCYLRKVRCDRALQCANCKDSGNDCQRKREIRIRKLKRKASKDPDVAELEQRMSSIENSVSQLCASVKEWTAAQVGGFEHKAPKKRREPEAVGTIDSRPVPASTTLQRLDTTVTSISNQKAQWLLQNELTRVPLESTDQRVALGSALRFLKDALNTEIEVIHGTGEDCSKASLDELKIPDPSYVQWMLQSEDTGRPMYSKKHFMPFVSRDTIARMASKIMETPREDVDPASIICVTAYAAYFLQEIVLLKIDKVTGLKSYLRSQAEQLFDTARKWTSHLARDASPNLANLQALTFGVMLAQEAGDFSTGWSLIRRTSDLCLALRLHKRDNNQVGPTEQLEAFYCLAICYMNDKGLAMNLGRPPFLLDSEIEIDILERARSSVPAIDNFYLYLSLAKVQGCMMEGVKSMKKQEEQRQAIENILVKMDDIWRLKAQMEILQIKDDPYAVDMETTMVELAFFSVQTMIYQSTTETLRCPEYNQAILQAAQAALFRVQKSRMISRLARYDSRYMKASFANWTILYYPFTPFFVLFCNIIRTNDLRDYVAMQDFVAYLVEIEDVSQAVAKLCKLCSLFLSLLATIISSYERRHTAVIAQRPANRESNEDTPSPTNSQQQVDGFQYAGPRNLMDPSFQPANAPWVPTSMSNVHCPESMPLYCPESLCEEFMGIQPTLQWLDSDFENVWTSGFGLHSQTMNHLR